ncbi:MAG: GNAT family N-acetyltransferase [Anaerolineales bacterium]
MIDLSRQLFEGEHIRLGAFEVEKDAEVISRWTHDLGYGRLTSPKPARPLSPAQVKKQLEEHAKEVREKRNRFDFAIRTKADERLVGTAQIDSLEWNHGHAWLHLSLGDAADRGKSYGGDALKLLLRYAFHELNLYRLSTDCFEYNPRGLKFLEQHGFSVEVRRRQAIHRDGRRWDELRLGLLREEWERNSGQ